MEQFKLGRLPRLGEPAPHFEALTTHGIVRLADYEGKWLVLFSHPADFTPVCTTEFRAFAELYPEFHRRGVELLGISVDSISSHIAWVRGIEDKMGVQIPFPVIADLNREVSQLYGMVHFGESETQAVRCVFVIDPNAIVRAMIYYPLNTGRNTEEVLRLVEALQTTDMYNVSTPANWREGEKVIVPPPTTVVEAAERLKDGDGCVDWYLCQRELAVVSGPAESEGAGSLTGESDTGLY